MPRARITMALRCRTSRRSWLRPSSIAASSRLAKSALSAAQFPERAARARRYWAAGPVLRAELRLGGQVAQAGARPVRTAGPAHREMGEVVALLGTLLGFRTSGVSLGLPASAGCPTGHACYRPPNLIRKMHGESLRRDALDGAVRDGVQQLLLEQNVRPAVQPQVELDDRYEPGKDAEVRVKVEALPNVPTPKIDKLALERLTVEPDEKAVDEQIKQLASQSKRWSDAPKKHAAAVGDLVVMDFEGKVGGKAFEGGAGEGMSVELGSGQLIPGF